MAEPCPKHPAFTADRHCATCAAPICDECVRNFGDYCSNNCLNAAAAAVPQAGDATRQRVAETQAQEGNIMAMIKKAATAFLVLLIVCALGLAWKMWLHPYGKVTWQIDSPVPAAEGNRFFDVEHEMMVKLGTYLCLFNPVNGEIYWQPDMGEPNLRYIEQDDTGLVLGGDASIQRFNYDGEVVWKTDFDTAQRDRMILAHSEAAVIVVESKNQVIDKKHAFEMMGIKLDRRMLESLEFMPNAVRTQTFVSAVSTTDGNELWVSPAMPENSEVSGCAVVGNVAVIAYNWFNRNSGGNRLDAFDTATGERKWQLSMNEAIIWGPTASAGFILYLDSSRLHYLDTGGKEIRSVAWDHESNGTPDQRMSSTMLMPGYDEDGYKSGIQLVDVKTGEKKWAFSLPGGVASYAGDSKHVFVIGHTSAQSLSADEMEMGSDLLGMDGALGANIAASAAIGDWTLVCLDRATGESKWQVEKEQGLAGEIVVGQGKLVVLQDTYDTSPTVRVSGKPGVLVINQWDPIKGKHIYGRTYEDMALRDASVRDGTLIGLAYERGGRNQGSAKCLGVRALRLK